MDNVGEPAQRLRAFDWVDYILYTLATLGFGISILSILWSGSLPAWLVSKKDFGVAPALDQPQQYSITIVVLGLFVVFVYMRNYLVMHRIDNRSDSNESLFRFLDFNNRGWYRAERIVRALIVLWVITSTIGVFQPVTILIDGVIERVVTATMGYSIFLNMSVLERFFTYYGFVLFVLFSLFILWDVINLVSISRQIKSGKFSDCVAGAADDDLADSTACIYAMPDALKHAIAVSSLVAYIRPRDKLLNDLSIGKQGIKSRNWVKGCVSSGMLVRLYFRKSAKFVERAAGLSIGTILLLTPWAGSQYIAILIALVFYLTVMLGEVGDTLHHVLHYFSGYVRHTPEDWDKAPRVGDFHVPPAADPHP